MELSQEQKFKFRYRLEQEQAMSKSSSSTQQILQPDQTNQSVIFKGLSEGLGAMLRPEPQNIAMGGLDPIQRFGQTALQSMYMGNREQLIDKTLGQQPKPGFDIGRASLGIGIDAISGAIASKIAPGINNSITGSGEAFNEFLNRNSTALSTSKGLPRIQRAEQVFNTRANQIVQRGENTSKGILDSLKNEVASSEAQIKNTKALTTESKQSEIAKIQNDYGKKILDAQSEIDSNVKAIPASAQRDSLAIKKEIPSWMGKQSERWNSEIDSAIGGKDADIFVNHNTVTDKLKSLLRGRGIEIDENGVASGIRGELSPSEERIAGVIKRLSGSDRAVSVRQLISDSSYLGKDIKYGKVFGSEQALLDDAKSIIAEQAEDILPSIKDTKAWYADYAQIRDRAFKSLDPYGGKYSTKATQFFKKLASGDAMPEDFQFLDDLERSVGKSAGRESFNLNSRNEMLKNFQESLKSSSEKDVLKVQASLDKEISRLDDLLKQKQVRYENIGNSAKDIISEKSTSQASKYNTKANEARIKLANLNRMKSITKWILAILAGEETVIGAGRKTITGIGR